MLKSLIQRHSLSLASCLMIALGLPSWQLASAQQTVFDGERVMNLLDEPRHRPVRQHGQVYLLDVRPKPSDESFAHVHDQAILFTHISLAGGPQNARVGVNIDYASVPLTHKVSNVGPNGMGIALAIENAGSRPDRYELVPDESTGTQNHINPSFVILDNEGDTRVSRANWLAPASGPGGSQVQRIK
jgi:hypothetical protein